VSLSRSRLRTLREIEQELAASDPELDRFFLSFTLRPGRRDAPSAERVKPWPLRMLARLWRGPSVKQRVKNWCAENWNDP
jgi:Protein of unknown function (DUF3040)